MKRWMKEEVDEGKDGLKEGWMIEKIDEGRDEERRIGGRKRWMVEVDE